MKLKDLKELYHTNKNQCCVCGCTLEDNSGVGLGAIFALDKDGKFYCCGCDNKFDDIDDRIFDEDLYPLDEYSLEDEID